MRKFLALLLLFLVGFAHAAVNVAGIRYEEKSRIGTVELLLNGAGMRSKYIFRAYTVGLYLNEKKTASAEVLALKGPKRLQIVTLLDLSAEDFANALVGGIQKNLSEAEIEPIKASIEEFKNAILAAKASTKGDIMTIDWLPESGTRLSINGKPQGKDIAGEDFYRALLKIWLGDKPAQDNLKDALLGKPQ